MNHSPDNEKYCLAELGDIKLYVSSYELSRDRRYNFQNLAGTGMYFTDNGSFPAYLRLKGYVLRSECASPCVALNTLMNNNMRFFLNMDGIFFNAARLKSFSAVTDIKSQTVKCEVTLCCDSYINETEAV